ncbi:hypothetical protein ACPC54_33855 [Kitasatospora sp. NPDC094028]
MPDLGIAIVRQYERGVVFRLNSTIVLPARFLTSVRALTRFVTEEGASTDGAEPVAKVSRLTIPAGVDVRAHPARGRLFDRARPGIRTDRTADRTRP